jgi:nucleoside-diphosphate-sugar epimerase
MLLKRLGRYRMSKLITGGTGFLGSQLAHLLVERGDDVVLFDVNVNLNRVKEIKDRVKIIQGNLAVWPEVMNAVKDNGVDGIYHLGSMLSLPSQANPWASFQANVCGTMNVLEAARLFDVDRVVFTSSLATYGLGVPQVVTDETLQRPTSFYGCGKVYCELVGRFYRTKFDLDFRTFRSPTLVGPGVKTPGVTQYISLMLENAALGRPYECYVAEQTKSAGFMYFKDSVRAVDMLYQAPKENIKMINYNVSGLDKSVSTKELEETIKKHVPEFSVIYKPDEEVVTYMKKYEDAMQVIDDTRAREEWGWNPAYKDLDSIVSDYLEEMRTRPEFFGIERV